MAAMSSGAPTARNRLNWPLKTVASRHNSGGQTSSRGGASSACAKDGPRLSAAIVTATTAQMVTSKERSISD